MAAIRIVLRIRISCVADTAIIANRTFAREVHHTEERLLQRWPRSDRYSRSTADRAKPFQALPRGAPKDKTRRTRRMLGHSKGETTENRLREELEVQHELATLRVEKRKP